MGLRSKVTRVLPSYQDLISDYLGMAQIILGFITLVLSIAGFIIKAFTSAASMGVFTAILLNITGILGVLAGIKKELWAISTYFGLSVITMIISLVLFLAAITAIGYESSREAITSVTARESLDICMVVLGLLCGSTCVCSILLAGIPLFTDSCKCAMGAMYVEEPNVQYSHEDIYSRQSDTSQQSDTSELNSQVGNDTNSVKETRHGYICSFENPQAMYNDSSEAHNLDLGQTGQGSLPI